MSFFYKENPFVEQKIEQYFQCLSDINNRLLQGRLSVLLLGSLSRGEGTWVEEGSRIRLLSDIEFFTIYPMDFNEFSLWDKILAETNEKIFHDETSILFHVDNTYVSKESLPKMERKLLTYDAQNMGVTVVGKNMKNLLPVININNINFCDLKDIMTHRVFSVLHYGFRLKREGDKEAYRYSLAKNSLDIMTAILAINNQLLSGFENRYKAIEQLNISEDIKRYFRYCLDIKFGIAMENVFTIEEMEKIFIDISDTAYNNFKIPIKNLIVNIKSISRRNLGKIKRAIRYRHIPIGNHYKRLSVLFRKGEELTDRNIKDNLVLNGYPI